MDFRHHPMSSPTLVTVPGWVLVILLVYVSQDTYTEAACPGFVSPDKVRMCEDSTVTTWDIYLDASSAEHVSATQCRCTLLNHGDGQVVLYRVTVPGYTGCGTSIEMTSTGDAVRLGCGSGYYIHAIEFNSGSTTNITLNKPATLSQSNAVDYCIDIDTASPSTTVRCWSPGQNDNVGDTTVSATNTQKPTTAIPNRNTESTAVTPKHKSATTTGIPDKTSTPTLGYTSSGQDCKQTTSDEKFPVEIVVPVVVVAVVLCVATIVGSVIYVRRHTDSKRNPTYDRHANTAAHDMHVYQDIH
ncbi:hypothetical protein ScPMuIL_004110 [Solemya velum]